MYVIVEKETNRVLGYGEVLDYEPEINYPLLVNENIAFPNFLVDVKVVESVPAEVITGKYCYTETEGFHVDPNWIEPNNPHGISNELYDTIRDEAVAQIEREVAGNANTETA